MKRPHSSEVPREKGKVLSKLAMWGEKERKRKKKVLLIILLGKYTSIPPARERYKENLQEEKGRGGGGEGLPTREI